MDDDHLAGEIARELAQSLANNGLPLVYFPPSIVRSVVFPIIAREVAAETERCARVAMKWASDHTEQEGWLDIAACDVAAAIRSR
jgi:hypothetical protein